MTFIDLQMTVRPKLMAPLAPACKILQKWFNSYYCDAIKNIFLVEKM